MIWVATVQTWWHIFTYLFKLFLLNIPYCSFKTGIVTTHTKIPFLDCSIHHFRGGLSCRPQLSKWTQNVTTHSFCSLNKLLKWTKPFNGIFMYWTASVVFKPSIFRLYVSHFPLSFSHPAIRAFSMWRPLPPLTCPQVPSVSPTLPRRSHQCHLLRTLWPSSETFPLHFGSGQRKRGGLVLHVMWNPSQFLCSTQTSPLTTGGYETSARAATLQKPQDLGLFCSL